MQFPWNFRDFLWKIVEKWKITHFIVSKNVFLSVISSGMRLKIRLRAADFLLSSWNASSDRFKRYSTTKTHKFLMNFSFKREIHLQSVSDTEPCRRNKLSFIFTFNSVFLIIPIIRSYATPGWLCSAFNNAALRVCAATTSCRSSYEISENGD